MNERTIFMEALERETPAQRSDYLAAACGGDAALRQRVEALLRSHEQAGNFLGKPPAERLAEQRANPEALGVTPEDTVADDKDSQALGFLAPSDRPDVLGRLGHYAVQEILGRGGMGIVLRAFDEKLHRVVAIKVMAAQLATNATSRRRFTREAQAAAAVCHDHVVTCHAVEEANGLPYLVMQYVDGLSLQQRLDRGGPLELQEILRIGMQTAAGLAAAHAQGLIHRDIKPANILLENGIERVKITDFGLARAAADASLTQSGVVAGTPHYMSPEQARGEAVDQRTDLFSLGSLLYAMCTGRAPFRASGSMAVLKRVCEETPTPICETNPEIPDWLAAVVDRLHAKDPAERFQSAAEVAELLGRHLAHVQHPSVAPLPAALSPLFPEEREAGGEGGGRGRRRRWAMAAAVLLLCAVGGLGLTEAAGVTNLRATVIRIFTPDGTLVVETDDPGVKVTIEGDGGLVITGAGPQEVRLKAGSYRVLAAKDGKALKEELVSISRGGKQVVKVSVVPKGPAPAAQIPRVPLGREIRRFIGHKDAVIAVAFSPNGRSALSGSWDGTVRLWDLETGKELRRFTGHSGTVNSVAFSPDGRRALSGGNDRTVRLWEVETGKELRRFAGHDGYAVAFSPDGRRALSEEGSVIRLWDLDSGKEVRHFQGHTDGVASAVFSSDGRRILSGAGWDSRARLWDVESGQQVVRLSGHGRGWVRAVALSPDGRRALSATLHDHLARLWDVEGEKELRRFQGHTGWVVAVAFSPDGRRALTASFDQTARLWDVETGKELCRFEGHTGPVIRAVFSSDGRQVLSGSEDGTVRLWQLPKAGSGQAPQPPRGAFVLLGGKGVAERKFDTLAEAVLDASDGDTIEIRGNGPFVSESINLGKTALTIRAGQGFRPVIKLNPKDRDGGNELAGGTALSALFVSKAPLVLEGLELQRVFQDPPKEGTWRVLIYSFAPLYAANCRFVSTQIHNCISAVTPICELRNCEFLGPDGTTLIWSARVSGARLVIGNCLNCAGPIQMGYDPDTRDIQLTRNTFVTPRVSLRLTLDLDKSHRVPKVDERIKLMRVEASGNVFDASLVYLQLALYNAVSSAEGKAFVIERVGWQGQRNLFAGNGDYLHGSGKGLDPAYPIKSLADWKQFWGSPEAGSIEGRVRYQGGDLLAKLRGAPEKLTPEDFRLRADSAGYRAGKDGKDLGADVNLVGPGPAYERWKKTPAYQQWLKDTGQVKKAEAPKAEPKAFVVLAKDGRAERPFASLAEAVRTASGGDTIEVRGNGPFVSPPMQLGGKALTIRAAAGYCPVLQLREPTNPTHPLFSTSALLVLEGLEIRSRARPSGKEPFVAATAVISREAPLRMANCRFVLRMEGEGANLAFNAYKVPDLELRNCQFILGPQCSLGYWHCPSGGRLTAEGNVMAGSLLGRLTILVNNIKSKNVPTNVALRWTRNTVLMGDLLSFDLSHIPELAGGGGKQPVTPCRLEASENLFDTTQAVLTLSQNQAGESKMKPLPAAQADALVRHLVTWQDQRNGFPEGVNLLGFDFDGEPLPTVPQRKTLADWQVFWGLKDTRSVQGRARYRGGDLRTRLASAPEQLTAGDFRLHPNSMGRGAGEGGRDLGANVDLVGPGLAYERWKKTPQYQQWLKDTGQEKK